MCKRLAIEPNHISQLIAVTHKNKSYLLATGLCHYNFPTSEICHYNSLILKLAITILHFFEPCHFIRLRCSWTHSQTRIFSYSPKYPCCFSPFNSRTCGAHTSASPPTSGLLSTTRCTPAREVGAELAVGQGGLEPPQPPPEP